MLLLSFGFVGSCFFVVFVITCEKRSKCDDVELIKNVGESYRSIVGK